MKDAIRRRGENISSFEVETEVCAHPAVKRSGGGRRCRANSARTRCWRSCRWSTGTTLDPAELIEFLMPRMAHFMVPRYVRIVPELPKTPTQKVQKHLLRDEGVTADTWDREAAGIRVEARAPVGHELTLLRLPSSSSLARAHQSAEVTPRDARS